MHLSSLQLACATLVAVALGATAQHSSPHHVSRRSFDLLDAQKCKGHFDAAKFARLDRVCDDCHLLYREPVIYTRCRNDCFTDVVFKGCVEVLLLTDEIEKFKEYIRELHWAPPITGKCFTSPYFKGCMESLYLLDEKEQIDQMIDFVGKR
ncbi:hypothetical protein PYW08_005862 [Mythimna loreyi]|uniref:Uncharacterized protein n=1 Tax=Mythimna loreyi TaxID=667449 RepID=A0ACC2QID2_9NEOP|nr:hypothetical protein PYW08_005862 [Mythimna loreyi]